MTRDRAPESIPVSHAESVEIRKPVRIEDIIRAACHYTDTTDADVAAKIRHPRVVLCREVIAYVARRLTLLSFPEIARRCGAPNHSTTITAYQRIDRRMMHEPSKPCAVEDDQGKPISIHELVALVTVESRRMSQTSNQQERAA